MANEVEPEKISLALSGGGFRATLFHLGVIRFLFDAQLLHNVKRICSVSGGSVLAAHLVLNWERYTGTEDQFNEAAAEIAAFCQRDVRGRVIRQWIACWLTLLPQLLQLMPFISRYLRLNRTEWLKRQYDALYKKKRLRNLETPADARLPRPDLHILATSLSTGYLCSFCKDGLWIVTDPFVSGATTAQLPASVRKARPLVGIRLDPHKPSDRTEPIEKNAAETLPVSAAVAASSAFPALFPPEPVTAADLALSEAKWLDEYLTDGGVFDNVGTSMLQVLETYNASNRIIISDAGLGFDFVKGRTFRFLTSRTVRMTEVLMNRAATLQDILSAQTIKEGSAVYVNIHEEIPNRSLGTVTQRKAATMRTDFDAFSDAEITVLVRHGYQVARAKCGKAERFSPTLRPGSDPLWCPIPLRGNVDLDRALQSSARRPWNLWGRDFATAVTVLTLLIYGIGAYWLSVKALAPASVQSNPQWDLDPVVSRLKDGESLRVAGSSTSEYGIMRFQEPSRGGVEVHLVDEIKTRLPEWLGIHGPVKIEPLQISFPQVLDRLRDGESDIAISSISFTHDRELQHGIAFSVPYFETSLAIVGPGVTSGTQLNAMTVEVQPKTTSAEIADLLRGRHRWTVKKAKAPYGVDDFKTLGEAAERRLLLDVPLARLFVDCDVSKRVGMRELRDEDFPDEVPAERRKERYAIAMPAGSERLKWAIDGIIVEVAKNGTLSRLEKDAIAQLSQGISHQK